MITSSSSGAVAAVHADGGAPRRRWLAREREWCRGACDCDPIGPPCVCPCAVLGLLAAEAAVALEQLGLQFQVQFQPLLAAPAFAAAADAGGDPPHQFHVQFQLLGGVTPVGTVAPDEVPVVPELAPVAGAVPVTLTPPVEPFICTIVPSSPGLNTRTITTWLLESPDTGGGGAGDVGAA